MCKFFIEFTWTGVSIHSIAQGRMFLQLHIWYLIFCLPSWWKRQFNIYTLMEKFNLTCSTFLWRPSNFALWGRQVFSAGGRSILTKNSPGAHDATDRDFGISLFRHKLLEGIAGQTALSCSYIESIRDAFIY